MSPTTDDDDSENRPVFCEPVFRVAVGSKNPCKISSVREAILLVFGRNKNTNEIMTELDIQGFSVPSGVSDQPFGDVSTWSI